MRDYLLDIVKHTLPLGAFTQLRFDCHSDTTDISAKDVDDQLVLKAQTHAPIPEFVETFGVPNLSLLNTLLNIPEYDESASIKLVTKKSDDAVIPLNIHFENSAGDFKNDFRLMSKRVIENLQPLLDMQVTLPVQFVPSVSSITRLKYQVSAHPDEKNVQFDVSNGEVHATVGDASTHSGSFMFHSGVDSSANYSFVVPSNFVLGALNMDGDKTIHLGELGTMITVDSGLARYDYIIPLLSK